MIKPKRDLHISVIDGTYDLLESARETALALIGDDKPTDMDSLLESENLETVEKGIIQFNEFGSKCWILSSILLYSVIYDKQLYQQSGLAWSDYLTEAKSRLHMDKRDISESLSSARFFIKYHKALERAGVKLSGLSTKLARSQLALELCGGDIDAVIEHLANDSWREFKEWYQSFSTKPALPASEIVRDDIEIKPNSVKVKGIENAVTISDELPDEDKKRIQRYISEIFKAIQDGYEPAIVPVYDTSEAKRLVVLRDKYRQGK